LPNQIEGNSLKTTDGTDQNMNRKPILSCALTGGGDTVGKHPGIPVTPKEIADSAIMAAQAGAAIAHIHVRDPQTGKPSRRVDLFCEVVDRIRQSETDVIINLTTGIGGDLYFGPDTDTLNFEQGTDCIGQMERLQHVEATLPEICSMDCGSFNYLGGNYTYISTQNMLEMGARRLQEIGVKPELEVFDLGQLWFARHLIELGLIDEPPMIQVCLGIPWGAEANTGSFKAFVDGMPRDAAWGGFGIGAMEMPMVAQSVMLGGNVRVGLEDNLYLEKGVLASNEQLVEKARKIVELMGCTVQSPAEARETLGLRQPTG
jgi:uncharacterized protein (DUF849 family)